jgi:hypothetical protein
MNAHSMSTTGHHWWESERRRTTAVQDGAAVVGLVFTVVGVLGFLPGITTDFDDIAFWGSESGAELFGIFQVSVLHNLIHLVFGLLGLFMAWFVREARWYLVGGGVVYLLLGMYGFPVADHHAGNFLPANTADDWLHVLLGLTMIALGLFLPNKLPKESEARGEGDMGETNRGAARLPRTQNGASSGFPKRRSHVVLRRPGTAALYEPHRAAGVPRKPRLADMGYPQPAEVCAPTPSSGGPPPTRFPRNAAWEPERHPTRPKTDTAEVNDAAAAVDQQGRTPVPAHPGPG